MQWFGSSAISKIRNFVRRVEGAGSTRRATVKTAYRPNRTAEIWGKLTSLPDSSGYHTWIQMFIDGDGGLEEGTLTGDRATEVNGYLCLEDTIVRLYYAGVDTEDYDRWVFDWPWFVQQYDTIADHQPDVSEPQEKELDNYEGTAINIFNPSDSFWDDTVTATVWIEPFVEMGSGVLAYTVMGANPFHVEEDISSDSSGEITVSTNPAGGAGTGGGASLTNDWLNNSGETMRESNNPSYPTYGTRGYIYWLAGRWYSFFGWYQEAP